MDSVSTRYISKIIARYPVPPAEVQLQSILFLQRFFLPKEGSGSSHKIVYVPVGDVDVEQEIRDALSLLLTGNIRLVRDIIRKAKFGGSVYLRSGVFSEEDLIQEGIIGIYRAIPRFDVSRGCVFPTYAYWWIRQGIHKMIQSQSRDVRIPASAQDRYKKIARIKEKQGRDFSIEKIAEIMSISPGIVNATIFDCEAWQNTSSLDMPYGKSDATTITLLSDTIASHSRHAKPEQSLNESFRDELLDQAIATLPEEEQTVITFAYGLNGVAPISLKKIWANQKEYFQEEILPLSYERVLKLKEIALARLKESFPDLFNYIEN